MRAPVHMRRCSVIFTCPGESWISLCCVKCDVSTLSVVCVAGLIDLKNTSSLCHMGFVVDDFTYIMRDHSARRWYVSFPEESYIPSQTRVRFISRGIIYPQNFSVFEFSLQTYFFGILWTKPTWFTEKSHFTTRFALCDAKKNWARYDQKCMLVVV
jgi:hypothetical protein